MGLGCRMNSIWKRKITKYLKKSYFNSIHYINFITLLRPLTIPLLSIFSSDRVILLNYINTFRLERRGNLVFSLALLIGFSFHSVFEVLYKRKFATINCTFLDVPQIFYKQGGEYCCVKLSEFVFYPVTTITIFLLSLHGRVFGQFWFLLHIASLNYWVQYWA